MSPWRDLLPLLASGLMTPHEGRKLILAMKPELTSDVIDVLHKSFRSMTVTLLSNGTPSHRLEEWAMILKFFVSEMSRAFPVSSDRFVSLRCMLLEGADIRDLTESEQAERPGVLEVIRLLESERRSMTISEIAAQLGMDMHSAASRIRIGIAIGRIHADHEHWERLLVSSTPAA